MTTIRIRNAAPDELDDIQQIVNAHGFGILADDGGDLISVSHDNLRVTQTADLEAELLDNVGKHLGVTFQ